jgi:hypothetical protein
MIRSAGQLARGASWPTSQNSRVPHDLFLVFSGQLASWLVGPLAGAAERRHG